MVLKIDLDSYGRKLQRSSRRFISVQDVVEELGVTPQAAGKLLSALARLGYLIKWSKTVYMVNKNRGFYEETIIVRE